MINNKIPLLHRSFLSDVFAYESSQKIPCFTKFKYLIRITPDDFIEYLNSSEELDYKKLMCHRRELFMLLIDYKKIKVDVVINLLINLYQITDASFIESMELINSNKHKYKNILTYFVSKIDITCLVNFIMSDIDKHDTTSMFHDKELYTFLSMNRPEFHKQIYNVLKIDKTVHKLNYSVDLMHELLIKHNNNTYNITCPICFAIPKDVYIYDCMHQICFFCAEKTDNKCGLCRKQQKKRKFKRLMKRQPFKQ
jgi:hypothetical protein